MKKVLLLFACLCFMGMQVFAQRTVTGTVTSADDGMGLPGVTVLVKGTTVRTVTDVNGAYSINAPADTASLVFEFMGMETQEVAISGDVVNAAMKSSDIAIDDVVVTALGISREKKKLGYSVSTVDNEDLTQGTSSNLTKALSGKVAGVIVSGGTGSPGSSTNVVLRGYANIGRSTQPLYVIDGVPVTNTMQNFSDGGGDVNRSVDFGNGINDINSADIESMSILRGAAATSQYGSQAANGVVMITTKNGKKKTKPSVNFSSSAVFSSVLKYPTYQDKWGQGWDGNFNSKENGSWGPLLDNQSRLWGNELDGKRMYKNFSFLKDQLRDFYDIGTQYDNSIAISGGGDNATYYASYNYVKSDGVVPMDKDAYDKHSFKVKSTMKVGRVSASASINYINNTTRALSTGQGQNGAANLFSDLLQAPNDIPLVGMEDFKDRSSFFNTDNFYTPYLQNPYFIIDNTTNEAKISRFIGNTSLTVDLVEAYRLKATFRMGGDASNTVGYNYDNKFVVGDGVPNAAQGDVLGFYEEFQNSTQQYNIDAMVSGGTNLMNDDLIIDANIGYNIFHRAVNNSQESVTGLIFENFPDLANSTAQLKPTGNKRTKRLIGLYGSADFSYKRFLTLQLSARNDWSSTLPKANNSYFYPAASLSFIVTDAFQGLKNNGILDYCKIRLGYGYSGNDAPEYVVYPVYAKGQVLAGLPFSDLTFPLNRPNRAGVTGYEFANQLGNPDLTPEITNEIEFGTELMFLAKRIIIDATYYNKTTEGMIVGRTIASTSGFTTMTSNIGEIQNQGLELSVNLTPIRTDNLKWDITYTFAKNNNKVVSLIDGLDEIYVSGFSTLYSAAIAGQTVSQIKGTGMRYTPDGRIIVDQQTGRPLDSEATVDLGTTLPDYTMGLSSRLSFKGFEFSFLLDYRKGGQFVSYSKNYAMWSGKDPVTTYNDRNPFVVPNSVYLDAATGEYVENSKPITKIDLNNYYGGAWNDQAQIIDKTFLKLREVNITYNIPKKFVTKFLIESASISLIGNNLLLFTPVENNIVDPEISTSGSDAASEFGEIGGYPSVRSYGFRLNINL